MSSYLNNLFSLQSLLTVTGSTASGAATAYAKQYPIKDAVIITGVTGFAASATTSFLDPETKTAYKAVLAAGTVLATLVALQSASNYLESKFGFVIDPKLVSYLTVANIVGVVVSFAICRAKPLLDVEAFDKLDDEAVKALHARMVEEGNKEFAESNTLHQLRMIQRFEALGLDTTKFEAKKLTADEIKELDHDHVKYLFKFRTENGEGKTEKTWTSWIEGNEEARNALVLRFLEHRFFGPTITKEILNKALASDLPKVNFEFPTTLEAIQALSTTDAEFFRAVYLTATDKWAELSIAAQWALVQGKTDALVPTFNVTTIKDAPKAAIEWYIKEINWLGITREIQKAIIEKCEAEGIEFKDALNPETAEEVAKLDAEAVKAYFPHFANAKYADSISDDVAAAFFGRFYELELKASDLPLEVFTPARIAKIHLPASGPEAEEAQLPKGKLPWIHRIYQALPENWYILHERDRHGVLKQRFADEKLDELFMPVSKQSDPVPDKLDANRHHAAFNRVPNGYDAWKKFTNSQQKTFNERFEAKGLSQMAVTSWFY